MKMQHTVLGFIRRSTPSALMAGTAALVLYPEDASALPDALLYFPDLQDGAPVYISAAVLLIVFIAFIVLMARRVIRTTGELNDITGELDATRQRLLETGKQLSAPKKT